MYPSDSNSNCGGTASNITGLISAGTNITLSGNGTIGTPYVINSSGGAGSNYWIKSQGNVGIATYSPGNVGIGTVTTNNQLVIGSTGQTNFLSNGNLGVNVTTQAIPLQWVTVLDTVK